MTTPQAALSFRFIEFNLMRALRGKEAARVEVIDPDDADGNRWLWMSRRDIKANMQLHGQHPELQKALEAYGVLK